MPLGIAFPLLLRRLEMRPKHIPSPFGILPLLGLFVAACSGDATGNSRNIPVTLSLSTRQAAQALASAGPVEATTAANTIVITKAQVVLDEIELKSSTTATCTESEVGDDNATEHEDDDCEEMKLDPMLVDL